MQLTFEDLPRAISILLEKVSRIEEMLNSSKVLESELSKSEPMTTKEVAEYLGVSMVSIYNYINRGALPYFKIGNKKYFKRSEVDKALKVK